MKKKKLTWISLDDKAVCDIFVDLALMGHDYRHDDFNWEMFDHYLHHLHPDYMVLNDKRFYLDGKIIYPIIKY